MKKLGKIFFLFFLLFPIKTFADSFYVQDNANILSSSTEEYIINKSEYLAKKTKTQIVVVTVKNLEGNTLEEFATDLFRELAIGDKEENNGLLLLLALEERMFRVEVGYGLEGVLTDGLTGRYQDEYMIPYFRNNEWDNGMKSGYNAFYKKLCDYYGITVLDVDEVMDSDFNNYSNNNYFGFIEILLLILLLISAVTFRIIQDNKWKALLFNAIVLLIIIIFVNHIFSMALIIDI